MATAVLPSVEQHVREVVSQLFEFITKQGDSDYIGEAVSQLEHSLQAAHQAVDAGADEETILGALLHDVGRFIPEGEQMPAMIAPHGTFVGRASHEVTGERYLRQLGFSDKICQLVGAHVMAKRYLTAVDKDYYDGLSLSSKTTLKYQGGIFNKDQVKEARKDPYLDSKLAVRRWDDLAKVPNMITRPLQYYEPMAVRNLLSSSSTVEVHGRRFRLPTRPTVVICVDGFDPEYLEHGVAEEILPNIASLLTSGFSTTAKCVMPSFTNPNNCSIITGVPTAVHGIAGNFFLDKQTGEEHMVQDDSLLRGTTILEQMSRRGVRVAAVTAKDKLRKIIGHGLNPGKGDLCFSSEKAGVCTEYSGDLSLFVLDAGVKILEEKRADLFYLTLSDFIQHHYGPGSKESNDFMKSVDDRVGRLTASGAVVAITADHEDVLSTKFGPGFARVICPITNPFVRHHGALGSFVRVYLKQKNVNLPEILDFCSSLPQVELAMDGETAAERFEMPLDREGDFVVIAKKNAVIGSRKEEHDLSSLADHRLRSHGGLSEQKIPLILSEPWAGAPRDMTRGWANFDAFELALNFSEADGVEIGAA